MTAIDTQADLITQVQTVLRQARNERDGTKLRAGNELMQSDEYLQLPVGVKDDCRALYRDAFVAVSGAFA
jgi:hypothetical protein